MEQSPHARAIADLVRRVNNDAAVPQSVKDAFLADLATKGDFDLSRTKEAVTLHANSSQSS